MQLFRPVEHAITDDGEWVTTHELPLDYMGQLKCGNCHASVVVTENKSGKKEFVHSRHSMEEIVKTRSCRYAIRPPASAYSMKTGINQPVKTTKSVTPIPRLNRRILQVKTIVRNWQCTWCQRQYYGNKQCPHCHEWVYALEADT
ncbi:MAG: zinc-ribbon domain-containing protein [Enterobacteriaceae bacterium]|jgi:hypothetical protein|nr:zinc-ribbon domain-containing protein [Enterobacteriaceae bacterium]